ncbi:hypothetical protein MJO28_012082 [Puccinia striiformis f. sp. tritici]|uniref:Uncharacterized protein n=1 Tax=Puccinia striiformis f. sp. tritici TaxID=168172 RepID=A0ACC0DYY2_9BASI|nr:hypothetical protein MJO28_012082 [Puccinia striiformis f. sp. tritici]
MFGYDFKRAVVKAIFNMIKFIGGLIETALISIPSLEEFSWSGLQTEFEKTIAFKARNSDPLSVPNYFGILYAYHINHCNFCSAVISMYQHGQKIGDIFINGGVVQYLMTQQCQSYLAAINAVALLPEKDTWIPISCPKTSPNNLLDDTENLCPPTRSKKTEEEFMGGSQDIEVLNLAHIRSEYMFVLSRLQLANEIPSLSQPGSSQTSETYLNGLTLVKMFLNQGRVMDAFEKATVLGTDIVPLFITLTQSFCRLTLEGSQGSNHFNFQWVNGDP